MTKGLDREAVRQRQVQASVSGRPQASATLCSRCSSIACPAGLSVASAASLQTLTLPDHMSLYMTQSPMKLYSGRLKLAGLFFSNTKWPIHAKP